MKNNLHTTLGFAAQDDASSFLFDGHILIEGSRMTSAQIAIGELRNNFQSLLTIIVATRTEKTAKSLDFNEKNRSDVVLNAIMRDRSLTLMLVEQFGDKDAIAKRDTSIAEAIDQALDALAISDKKGTLRIVEMPIALAAKVTSEMLDKAYESGVRFIFTAEDKGDIDAVKDVPAVIACKTRLIFDYTLKEFRVESKGEKPFSIEMTISVKRVPAD